MKNTQHAHVFHEGSLFKLWPKRNEVFLVGKCDYTPAVLLWDREKILEDIWYLYEKTIQWFEQNTYGK